MTSRLTALQLLAAMPALEQVALSSMHSTAEGAPLAEVSSTRVGHLAEHIANQLGRRICCGSGITLLVKGVVKCRRHTACVVLLVTYSTGGPTSVCRSRRCCHSSARGRGSPLL